MNMNNKASHGITVEIWSDIACPWCYIGKRRFESALERFPHRDAVRVIWRSYQLAPDAPRTATESLTQMLANKYGVSTERAETMHRNVTQVAAGEGLVYHMDTVKPTNTFDAHRLIHAAARFGKQAEAKERLLRAYFTEGVNVSDREALVSIAKELGLPDAVIEAVVDGVAESDAVRADLERGAAFGIRGVPFFVLDERLGVSGAQDPETLLGALQQAWAQHTPAVAVIEPATAETNICEDDTCAVPNAPQA